MKFFLIFLIIIFINQPCFSQQKEIDSLETVFSQIKTDSSYNKKLGETIVWYRNRNPKINLYFIKKALKKSINDKDEYRNAYWTRELAFYYEGRGDLDSTYYYLNKSLLSFKANNNERYVHILKSSLAQYWQDVGDYTKSITCYNEAISFFEKQGEKDVWIVILIKMNLSSLYNNMEQYEDELKINKALYFQLKNDPDRERFGRLCSIIARAYMNLEKYEEGLKYAFESEKIKQSPNNKASLYINIGGLYAGLGNYVLSDQYYKKALKIFKEIGSEYREHIVYHNVGDNLMLQKKYKEAEYYLLKTNAFFEKNDVSSLSESYLALTELYEKKKDYKKAISYYKKREVLRDSLIGIEKQKAIADIEVKYETEKVKREKETAEKSAQINKLESAKNKNLFIGAAIIGVLIFLSSLFYFGRFKATKKAALVTLELKETQKRLAIEKQYRDSELKALKAQMNPHFIFNALNSIQEYIVLNQKNLASDYLARFADLMRKYLQHSDKGSISIQEEIDCLNMYLELEKVRFEDKLQYTIEVNSALNTEELSIPTMIIQPYVENALKHGLLHKKDNRKLNISVSKKDACIICIIKDNGVGRARAKEIQNKRRKEHQSFATKATENRLDLLNFGKDKKIGIQNIDLFDSDHNASGTKVIMTIPYTKT